MSSENALSITGLGKAYPLQAKPHERLLQMLLRKPRNSEREFQAVSGIDLELKRGETLGIIGRNGSGKSTLLQMICGTLNPSCGELQVNGRVAALLELGAGFNPEFTGRENVYLAASLYGLSRSEIDSRFGAIAAFADIGVFIEQPVKTYSSGMYVRLAFAVVAHVDADILVIDEALAVGDALFTQKCMRFIRAFRQQHTLIFVSHDTASVISLCDRVLWLDQGRPRALGDAKPVCERYLNDLFSHLHDGSEVADVAGTRGIARVGEPALAWRDQRSQLVNSSPLRNDLEVFRFTPEQDTAFGGTQATIAHVSLTDSSGAPLNWAVGGEQVVLKIEVEAHADLAQPIVGFFLKDRLGQTLFGDNTYLSYQQAPCAVQAGARLIAQFGFYLPWLARGDYVIQVAVANGTQQDHKQLHWLHDALVIRSHHDPVSTGLVGIPFTHISLHAA